MRMDENVLRLGANFRNATAAVQNGEFGDHFAVGFCGPRGVFRELVEASFRTTGEASAGYWAILTGDARHPGLDALDVKFRTASPSDDATIPHRWAAQSAVARAVLAGHASEPGRGFLRDAAGHFRKANQVLGL